MSDVVINTAHYTDGSPAIAVEYLDEVDGLPRVRLFPPSRWRSAARLVQRIRRREEEM